MSICKQSRPADHRAARKESGWRSSSSNHEYNAAGKKPGAPISYISIENLRSLNDGRLRDHLLGLDVLFIDRGDDGQQSFARRCKRLVPRLKIVILEDAAAKEPLSIRRLTI